MFINIAHIELLVKVLTTSPMWCWKTYLQFINFHFSSWCWNLMLVAVIDQKVRNYVKWGILLGRSVITNPKCLSDIRNDIWKVISETFCISDIQSYCLESFDIPKVADRVGLVCCNYPLKYQMTQLTPIVMVEQGQSTPDSNIDHCRTSSNIYCYQ